MRGILKEYNEELIMKSINKPLIKLGLDKKDINCAFLEEIIYDSTFEMQELSFKINKVEFNGCVFKNIKFSEKDLTNI